jgi:ElaB/YqjD/DUF883 family membrane-anchored ribosome-binding protein
MENNAGDRVKEHVKELQGAYRQGTQSVRDLSQAAVDTSKEAVAYTDEWVRTNAWKLLAFTFGIGLVAGLLFSRRSPEPKRERLPR